MSASVFDLKTIQHYPYGQREKNVFFSGEGFKTRIIVLPPGGSMPDCQMPTAVIFHVVAGSVEVEADGVTHLIGEGHCLVGGPGRFAMRTADGARLLGVQISTGKVGELS
jgi:quercetin dioxygenase-like cupin family protein